jgi:hypothetical protein
MVEVKKLCRSYKRANMLCRYHEIGVERNLNFFSKHMYQLSVYPATNALTQNATYTVIKTTSLNTAVPFSGDYETTLYKPNTPHFRYYIMHY